MLGAVLLSRDSSWSIRLVNLSIETAARIYLLTTRSPPVHAMRFLS